MTSGPAQRKSGSRVGLWTGIGVFALNAKGLVPIAIKGGGLLKFAWLFTTIGSLVVSLLGWAMFYGWRFGCLIILMLLVHEMGHWLWMKCYKLNPSAPIFVPFLGAFVAMRTLPGSEATRAWVAFAGPFVGGMSALVLYYAGVGLNNGLLISTSEVGFIINFLQLIPARPLDGGFIVGCVSRWLMIPGILIVLAMGAAMQSMLLFLIALISIFAVMKPSTPTQAGYAGAAKTLGELEKEIQENRVDIVGKALAGKTVATADDVHAAVKAAPSLASQRPTVAAAATGKQRLAIGFAYLTLVMVLGVYQFKAVRAAMENRDCVQGDAEMQTQMMVFKHDNVGAHESRGEDYIKLGKYDLAFADFESAVQIRLKDQNKSKEKKDSESSMLAADYKELAFCQLMSGKSIEDVIATLVKGRDVATDDAELFTAGYGLAILGSEKEARVALKKCSDLSKPSLTAVILRREGKTEESARYLDKTIDASPGWGSLTRRAMYRISVNKLDMAEEDIDFIFDINTAHSDGQSMGNVAKAWLLLAQGEKDKAIAQADKAMQQIREYYSLIDRLQLIESCHAVKKYAYEHLAANEKNSANSENYKSFASVEGKCLSPNYLTKNIYALPDKWAQQQVK